MKSKYCFVFLLIFCTGVQSDSIFVNAFNYVIDFGMNMTPQFMSVLECVGNDEAWGCAREKAGKMLDIWSKKIEDQQKIWERKYSFFFLIKNRLQLLFFLFNKLYLNDQIFLISLNFQLYVYQQIIVQFQLLINV